MGAYLNRPVVEKEKEEGSTDTISYAVTTMQGWRANQEDAHNCVTDLHDGWHMFAVYDGHGGTEVSKFTSAKLPDFLKNRKFWDATDVEDCLQKAFVDFDDFIRSEDSMKELKEICKSGKKKQENDSEDEADRIDTIEESGIPIADLIKRYGVGGGGRSLLSAFLQNQTDDDSDEDEEDEEEEEEEKEESKPEEEGEKKEEEAEEVKEDVQEEKSEGDKKKVQKRCSKSPILSQAKKSKSSEEGQGDNTTSEEAQGSSSAASAPEGVTEEEEEDSDAEFVADEDEEGAEDEEVSDEEEAEPTDLGQLMLGGGAETPGEDSGTTACVCLIGKDKVIVVNAGDSRAVLCRAGKAVDLSIDHKPEDQIETNRIRTAGGVIEEGRVNGGLNLSRALGDHAYKKNADLPLKDQMITAHPDVKIESLTPEDEFIVVACDGIWNSMESQQVVDFVRKLIGEGKTCSEICDALCDECLADSTEGDGTGCDNMTVICTTFKR